MKIPVTENPFCYSIIFLGSADQWKPYVEAYAKQFRTIAIDMMGHGRSDIYKKDEVNFRHADYANIILALLDSLKLSKVNAIGASSGGTTLLHLNTSQPERFKSVIIIGGHTYYSKYCRDWITKVGLKQFYGMGKNTWAGKTNVFGEGDMGGSKI